MQGKCSAYSSTGMCQVLLHESYLDYKWKRMQMEWEHLAATDAVVRGRKHLSYCKEETQHYKTL